MYHVCVHYQILPGVTISRTMICARMGDMRNTHRMLVWKHGRKKYYFGDMRIREYNIKKETL